MFVCVCQGVCGGVCVGGVLGWWCAGSACLE